MLLQRQGEGKEPPFHRDEPFGQDLARSSSGDHKLWYSDQIFRNYKEACRLFASTPAGTLGALVGPVLGALSLSTTEE